MAGDANVLLDIRGSNASALRAIASTKAALSGLSGEQKALVTHGRAFNNQQRELGRLLERQRRSLRALTGDYVALRRALFTLGIRAAIAGMNSLAAVVVSLGADVIKLGQNLKTLGSAMAVFGSSAVGGMVQGLTVWKLAMNDVGKALNTTGEEHKKAMEKLTKSGRDLVRSLKPVQQEISRIKELAQRGMAPALARAAQNSKKAFDVLNDTVYNTATAMGYLVEHGVDRVTRRLGEFRRVGRTQIITMRRLGDSAIELADAWLAVSDAARPLVNQMSGEILTWAKNQRKAIRQAKQDGDLASYFNEARRAWETWTSTLGATGRGVAAILDSSADSARRMANGIKDAAHSFEDWAKSSRGRSGIQEGMRALEPVSKEIGLTLKDIVVTLSRMGVNGAANATRVLKGFRTQVLPVLEEMGNHLNEELMPSIIDLSEQMVVFFRNARPAMNLLSAGFSAAADAAKGILEVVNKLMENMPPLSNAIGGLAITATLLIGWSKFKTLLELSLLTLRQMVGLAPKMSRLGSVAGGASKAGGGVLATSGISGSAGRNAGATIISSSDPRRSTGMRAFGQAMPMRPGGAGPGVRDPDTGRVLPSTTVIGGGGMASTRRNTILNPQTGRTFRQPGSARILGPLQPLNQVVMTGGDPLTGRRGGGSAAGRQRNAGTFAAQMPRGINRADVFAARSTVMAKQTAASIKDGVSKGVAASAPAISKTFKIAAPIGIISGIAGMAGSSGELSNKGSAQGRGNMVTNFLSGATFGLIESTDSKASRISQTTARSIQQGGQFDTKKLGFDSGPKLNLNRKEELDTLKQIITFAERDLKITKDQAAELRRMADQRKAMLDQEQSVRSGAKNMGDARAGHPFIDPDETKRSLGVLTNIFEGFKTKTNATIGDSRQFVKRAMRSIKKDMVEGSQSAKSATSTAFQQAALAIKDGMRAGTIDARRGARELERIFRKNLAIYGIKGQKADRYLNGQDTMTGKRDTSTNPGGATVGGPGYAKGTFVGAKGMKGQDTVPAVLNGQNAMIANGEYVGVFNATQQQAFDRMAAATGYGSMQGFMKSNGKPHHMAGGGIVPIPGEPGESISSSILNDVLRLKKRYRLDITDGYAASGHAPNGEHPLGLAIDVVPGEGGSWDMIDKLAAWAEPTQNNPRPPFRWVGYNGDANHGRGNHLHLSWQHDGSQIAGGLPGAAGAAFKGGLEKIKKVMASGELPGPFRALVQGGINGMRRGAQTRLDGIGRRRGYGGPEGAEAGAYGSDYHGPLNRVFPRHIGGNPRFATLSSADVMEVADSVGLPARTFDLIAKGESARQPGVQQPDPGDGMVGYGLWQNTPNAWGSGSSAQGMLKRLGGIGQMFNPIKNGRMAKYLYENAGSKIPNTAGFPWYGTRFLDGGAILPPDSGANSPPASGNNTTGKSDQTQKEKNKKKQDPRSKKPDPKKDPKFIARNTPKGVRNAIQQSKNLLKKGKGGKVKGWRIRPKLTWFDWMLGKGQWFDDPNFVDPLTGEPRDAEQMPMFRGLRAAMSRIDPLTTKVSRIQDANSLTDEYATVSLSGADLNRYLASQGMDAAGQASWIATYGDSLEVSNTNGMNVGGRFMRGINQYAGEVGGEIGGWGRLRDNYSTIVRRAKKAKMAAPIADRERRLKYIRKIFESNVKLMKKLKKKLDNGKKKRTWKQQVSDNEDLIRDLQRHKRDSDNMPDSYKRRIDGQIDSLQDVNRDLREKKPRARQIGLEKVAFTYQQRARENRLIAGGGGVDTWPEAVQGSGWAGMAANSLANWKGLRQYKRDSLKTGEDGVYDANLQIARLQKDLADFKASGIVLPPTASGDGVADQLAEFQKAKDAETIAALRLRISDTGTLSGFAQALGMRSVGSFAHGTDEIVRSGMAMVHAGESIAPDPEGAFGSGIAANRLAVKQGGVGGGNVYLVADGDLGALLRLMKVTIKQQTADVSRQQGRRTRSIARAPGR